MYVRRKNCEYGRIKRSCRKPKPCDTFYTIFGSYLKLIAIWLAILFLDFLMEFRFEYMWPCWLLLRTINDSFKYQGLTFAIFFTMIALTSDIICYLLVPSSWLFLFGSTCVWMELVWHAERSVCGPTVGICFLFLYVEVAARLRDPKSIPLSIDLCRPFAAHCIGYPVVTLGFGLKSLLTHHLRLRRQHQVEAHNSKYFCLLELALPEEARTLHRRSELGNGQLAALCSSSANTGNLAIGATPSPTGTTNAVAATSVSGTAAPTPTTATSRSSRRQQQQQHQNLGNGKSTICDNSLASNHPGVDRRFLGFDGGDQSQQQQHTHHQGSSHQHHHQVQHSHQQSLRELGEAGSAEGPAVSSSCSSLSGQEVVTVTAEARGSSKKSSGPGSLSTSSPSQGHTATAGPSSSVLPGRFKAGDKASRTGKEASVYRLEDELRKLRHERQSMLVTESELRAQLAQLTTLERTSRTETNQARQEVEYLQSKLTTLTQRLETERENLQLAEKRNAEEKRQRTALEVSLAAEKRARREAENALKAATAASAASNPFGSVTSSPQSIVPGSKSGTKLGTGNSRSILGSSTGVTRCTSEYCVQRIQELQSALKEAQLVAASQSNLLKQSQQQQQQMHHMQSSEQNHRIEDLRMRVNELEVENVRIRNSLKAEEKMKQDLLNVYHKSLKEITELNSTLTRKEYQIVDLHMRLDMMIPNSPFHYLMGQDNTPTSSGASDSRAVGGHPRPPSAISFLNPSSSSGIGGSGGGNSGLFSPRPIETDYDFGGGSGGGGGGGGGSGISSTAGCWPIFQTSSPNPSSSVATSVAFAEPPIPSHHQRLRSDSTNAVINALIGTREERSTQPVPPRFDSSAAEVDLEAASSSLSPPEFLSKLRSQLAMAGAAGGMNSSQAVQPQPTPPSVAPVTTAMHTPVAPISPPSRDLVGGISSEVESRSPIGSPTAAVGASGEADSDAGSGMGVVVGDEMGVGTTGGD